MGEPTRSGQLTTIKIAESPSEKKEFRNSDNVDSNQILRNLSLSVEQRLEEHQQSLNLCLELMSAGKKLVE